MQRIQHAQDRERIAVGIKVISQQAGGNSRGVDSCIFGGDVAVCLSDRGIIDGGKVDCHCDWG